MYHKILVPLDGSELAELALPYAEELASRLGSEITLIYVSESARDPYHHMHEFYLEKIVDATKHCVQRHLEKPQGQKIGVSSALGMFVGANLWLPAIMGNQSANMSPPSAQGATISY